MTEHKDNDGKEEVKIPDPVDLFPEAPLVIPVIAEKLVVEKKIVETGKVLISKTVTEERAVIHQPVHSEEVVVTRKEINQFVDSAPPAVRQEGDVTIISVVKEVLVVEKRLKLVEELHITKLKTEKNEAVSVDVLKEEVTVSRTGSGTNF